MEKTKKTINFFWWKKLLLEMGKNIIIMANIKFEGEYLNGKIWNGKMFSIDGNAINEMSIWKGYMKEYNSYDVNLIFEGEYLNGERWNGSFQDYGHVEEYIYMEIIIMENI